MDEKKETEEKIIPMNLLRKIDEFQAATTLKKSEIELAKERVLRSEKECRLLSAEYTLKLKESEELKRQHKDRLEELKELQNRSKKLGKEIEKELDLPDKWTFDPDTGEIEI
jgi:hypothetical protein